MIIDSHMHINSTLLNNKACYIDKINNNRKIDSVVNVGLNIVTSKESIDISKNNKKFYSSVGIHPLYITNYESLYDICSLITDKVVAIGEIGLDSSSNNFYEQKKYLIKQIMIANELHLPVIIHSNNTNKEIIDVFNRFVKPKFGCVFHCFQPDLESLKYIISNGYYVSFAGKITYKNAKKSIEIIKQVPTAQFLIETDSPYISPESVRNLINETGNIEYIIQQISDVKRLLPEEIQNMSNTNAKKLFKKIK